MMDASWLQKQVDRKVPLNSKMLSEKVEEVKGAIMICYPMGLPQWDVMRLIVEDSDEGTASVCLVYHARDHVCTSSLSG
jgi:hypothetical protein